MSLATLTDGTRLRFVHEGEDVLAIYDNLPSAETQPGNGMVYALVGEHSEASRGYLGGLRSYAYGSDPRLDGQVDRIVSILEGRVPDVRDVLTDGPWCPACQAAPCDEVTP